MISSLKRVLVTGAAGFIGNQVSLKLVESGVEVLGIDNLNDYYDPQLKLARLERLSHLSKFKFEKISIENKTAFQSSFDLFKPNRVIHLAAQAGVRHSISHPDVYITSNITGFLNILEACRHAKTEHLVYASTSSVYGLNTHMPFSTHESTEHPISLYAATKKANEMMAHSYSYLYGLPTTGLRFFTVYGPWGRPDMMLFIFTKKILAGETIDIFNHGNHKRDFTYIDDIVDGVIRAATTTPAVNPKFDLSDPDPASSSAPYRIYNIGNHEPVPILDFVHSLEAELGKKAQIRMLPLQAGDVAETFADISELSKDCGFKPTTSYRDGIAKFVKWYREFYRV